MNLTVKYQPAGPLFASAVLPGLGQLISGRKRVGLLVLGLLACILGCFFVGTFADNYIRWVCLFLALILLWLSSVVDYVVFAVPEFRSRPSMLWFALPLACVCALISMSLAMRMSHHHPYSVTSASMAPTIYPGDSFFVDERYYKHHALADGDIIAFRHNNYIIIKRISALPGESIEGKNGVLLRNDVELEEPYAKFSSDTPNADAETFAAKIVPTGSLFVTGDARDRSLDSRIAEFGELHTTDVVGRVTFIYASRHDQTGITF